MDLELSGKVAVVTGASKGIGLAVTCHGRRPGGGARAIAGIPSGRYSTPEEVATLVTLLASPRTANVTGANYVIDGGLVKTI